MYDDVGGQVGLSKVNWWSRFPVLRCSPLHSCIRPEFRYCTCCASMQNCWERNVVLVTEDGTGDGRLAEQKQESQLSQRDRALLRVVEYFAKSLKVIRNDTIDSGVCKSLLVFHCNDVCISYAYCFWDMERQLMAWPWNLGCESSKVIENDVVQ